jgi:ribosome modulation factor
VKYREAFQQGALACREGLGFENCPWVDDDFRKQAWRDGWESAMTWVLEKAYS